MKVTLRMKYGTEPVRPPTAWFLVGRTAEEWLAELTSWETVPTSARLFVVPKSLRDRTPCGVLVLDAAPPSGKPSPRALAYGTYGRRLRLPVEAGLDPDVRETEVDALLEFTDELYIWHPQAGLISFSDRSALRVSQLLAAPETSHDSWDAAVSGIALNAKLSSLQPTEPPTARTVLEEGRGDIGSRPLDINQLPPAPNEPASGWIPDVVRGVEKGLAQAAQWLAGLAPSGASGRTWVNALGDWAQSKLGRIAASLETSRNREILRLMELLQHNPDQGLRFAIPFGGGDHRGLASPGNQLGRRNVDFNLNQLRGGQAADYWNIPAHYQTQLIRRYRELAAREIALGRHRRAAYIFATLLNDLRASASTLEDGGHYREAAVLYDEKLKQPQQAAACLKKGGLWTEALALYERLGEFETIGDLYVELEQPDEAATAWRRAVEQKLSSDDVLSAARLLERKLQSPDEALEQLTNAWPRSRQAQACVTEAFQLLARRERHRQAATLLGRLMEQRPRHASQTALVEVLASQACDYPDALVRERAADETRVVVADRLSSGTIEEDEAQRLVAAVGRLVPHDRLLPRDGHRLLQLRRLRATAKSSPPRMTRRLTARHEVLLSNHVDWKTAVGTEDAIYVAGYRDTELVVARTDWHGSAPDEPIGRDWRIQRGLLEYPIALVADPLGASPLIVHVPGTEPLSHDKFFKADDRFPEPLRVGAHRGLSQISFGLCYSGRESLHIVDVDSGPNAVVIAYLASQVRMTGLNSIDLSQLPYDTEEWTRPIPCLMRERYFILGIGRNLCFVQRDKPPEIIEMPGIVRQLIGSASGTRSRLAIATAQGGVLLWGDGPNATCAPFATEMVEPRIALARDGSLIAASKDEIDIYSTADGHLKLQHRRPGLGSVTLAVFTTRLVNRFATVQVDGRICIFDVAE
jgi:tetratricopeptide (TPR) repeat protein